MVLNLVCQVVKCIYEMVRVKIMATMLHMKLVYADTKVG